MAPRINRNIAPVLRTCGSRRAHRKPVDATSRPSGEAARPTPAAGVRWRWVPLRRGIGPSVRHTYFHLKKTRDESRLPRGMGRVSLSRMRSPTPLICRAEINHHCLHLSR